MLEAVRGHLPPSGGWPELLVEPEDGRHALARAARRAVETDGAVDQFAQEQYPRKMAIDGWAEVGLPHKGWACAT